MSAAGDVAPASGAPENAKQVQPDSRLMDGLSSSKVTVEYHDPSGLFPLVQEPLTARLPLRNLHWKSPARPLRSIDSLHVDLVASEESVHISGVTSPGLAPEKAQGTPTPTTSEHIKPPSKERRHQIPGLRQTPYLKVFLLRCDDSDTYKSNARKQLREWVKAHTPPSQSSSSSTQENHDAFEWIIIHVVIPDTQAASQPRGSTTATGEKEKVTATSRWTRGTTTILEKIRADFNSASKSAPDRVCQIRLQKDAVPPHMLPTTTASVSSPPITESPQEQEKSWNDLIAKFKTLILLSFDLRVRQYEEDIREKDSQRALPGWNFCTFFILKEGLARGFESVGLVEDALLGYDELSIGLDTILSDQAAEGSETQGGVLLDHSEDLYQRASEILEQLQKVDKRQEDLHLAFHDEKPINAKRKDFRGLILSNNISVFDFRLYVFARQMSLLLRLGNSHSARSDLATKLQPRPNASVLQRSVDDSSVGTKLGPSASDAEDLYSLAELCSRALNFITFAGRLLRHDLANGAKTHEASLPDGLVDNIVRSWTYAALDQVLQETATSSLPFTRFSSDSGTTSSSKLLPFGKYNKEQKISVAEPKSMIHPSRWSSLNYGRSNSDQPAYAQPTVTGQVVFENGQYRDQPAPNQDSTLPQAKSGTQELAGTRAQLLVVQRRILEHIGKCLEWNIGWAAVVSANSQDQQLSEVDLDDKDSSDDESADTDGQTTEFGSSKVGISAVAVVNALSSIDQFRHHYEILSDLIVKHYMAAGQTKSGESVLGDLAALRFELGDYAAAAMYFGRMASMFAESRWNTVETTMLKMYARCLKKLNRKDEYVRTLLDLLAKSAASRKTTRSIFKRASSSSAGQIYHDWLDDDRVDTSGTFDELIKFSEQLPYDVSIQMNKYFSDINVEPYVRHFDDKDGFQLRLQIRHVLEDKIKLNSAKIRLVSADGTQGKEIWLESSETIQLTDGIRRIWLDSNVNTTGPYLVDKIILQAQRISFIHEPFAKTEATTPLGIMTSVSATSVKAAKKSRVLCFPRPEAFRARTYLAHFIHIDKQRNVEVECSSGWNDIKRAEIRLRSASAGLRLRTANAMLTSGDVKIGETSNPGVIPISAMSAESTATFRIPYDMETVLPELMIKVEVDYHTNHGRFQYLSSFTIPIELPLDVNVHDHFKDQSLFSKFNIKTANHIPLHVLEVALEGSDDFYVQAPRRQNGSSHVFPKQPVAMTYKISKSRGVGNKFSQSSSDSIGSLSLSVKYRCMNEDILDRLRALFVNAVKESPARRLTCLLSHIFVDRLEHRILPHQYEKIALLDEVDMGLFDDMGWSECIESLPQTVREDTNEWLQKWHEDHRVVPLSDSPDQDAELTEVAPPSLYPPRHMIITVSIPQTHILHTTSLSITSTESSQTSSHSTIAVVGQPLTTNLQIKHTRKWGSSSNLLTAANIKQPDDAIEFVYTVEANPDLWLVAGQRRAHFLARENEEHNFPFMLVPLKPGNALLPNVEIRPRIASRGDAMGQSGASGGRDDGGDQLTCETDYLNHGECVMVVPDVRSSTVGVGDMGMPRSAVWLESDSRGSA